MDYMMNINTYYTGDLLCDPIEYLHTKYIYDITLVLTYLVTFCLSGH